MKKLIDVFNRIDRTSFYRIRTYGTKASGRFEQRKMCLGLEKSYGEQSVYKVIETRDYKTYEYKVDVLLARKDQDTTQETVYELIEIN